MPTNINLDYLVEFTDGNKEFLSEMIQTFLEKIPYYSSEFKTLHDTKDWVSMQALAHKAKTTFLLMGIKKLSEDSIVIERLCFEGGKEEEIGRLINQMDADLLLVREAMNKLLAA